MRRSAGTCILVIGLFCTALFTGGRAVAAPIPTLTRLRIVLTESAEWASFRLEQGRILAHHVTAQSRGSEVRRGSRSVVLRGSDPASATVDVIANITDEAHPVIALAKSKHGTAALQVYQTNGAATLLADITNYRTDGDATVRRTVSRSAIVGSGVPIPMRDPRRLVLARYYPWFGATTTFAGEQFTDRPSGPYRTDDPASVASMVNQAASSGIDGFIVNWNGQNDGPNRFDLVMSAAQARPGFLIAPAVPVQAFTRHDGSPNLDEITNQILATLQRAGSATFLKSSGRPVVFIFGAFALGADKWRQVVARVAAGGQTPFYIGEPVTLAFGFDGSYAYDPNPYSQELLARRNINQSRSLRVQSLVNSSVPQRLWAATVSPGENMGQEFPRDKEERPRADGARYDQTWMAALKSVPEWVIITSWNEWYEGTHIQPSEKYGTQALTQTKAWSTYFKDPRGAPPAS